MAYIHPRTNKAGEVISYEIRVAKGYDAQGNRLKPYTMTYKPEPGMTPKKIEKELNRQAALFEEKCKQGLTGDGRQKFATFADYVLELKEQEGLKHSTLRRYRDFLPRINAGIGHIKLEDLRPQHLDALYKQLAADGLRVYAKKAVAKPGFHDLLRKKEMTMPALAEQAGVSLSVVRSCKQGKCITMVGAEKVAAALHVDVAKLFRIEENNKPLSNKTIVEHHRLIHTILEVAVKKMVLTYNPADRATPPKVQANHPNYFQPEDVAAIRDALEQEPMKWKTIVHLLLVTGMRRGELAALRWENVDLDNCQLHVCGNLLYAPDRGVYLSTPKTEESDRFVKIPKETAALLREYQAHWLALRKECGSAWSSFVNIQNDAGQELSMKNSYLFVQDSGKNIGKPMHPDSITGYCDRFSERYGLPHINPHAFRHTMASILYFNGVDSISISNRLGHAKPSTTTDMYSHIIREADERAAECIADSIFTGRKKA